MENNKTLPITILIIGIIISLGIFFSRIENTNEVQAPDIIEETINIQTINDQDHILGNPNARIVMVEYSDFGCPFCRQFHPIMRRILREFGPTGDVAWVYRNFSIEDMFENSLQASLAAECVVNLDRSENELIFWDFANLIFQNAPVKLDIESLIEKAIVLDIEENEFIDCVQSQKYLDKIERNKSDVHELLKIDSSFSTPYTLLFTHRGLEIRISGTVPYEHIRNIIEEILDSL